MDANIIKEASGRWCSTVVQVRKMDILVSVYNIQDKSDNVKRQLITTSSWCKMVFRARIKE